MPHMTIAERATSIHGLLKCRVLTTLDLFSLSGQPWRTSGEIARGLGQSAWGVPRSERGPLLGALGKWAGRYRVPMRGGHTGLWPANWRLVQSRQSTGHRMDGVYEYSLTRRGQLWLQHSRVRAERRCGLAAGDVVSEVSARLGLAVYFPVETRRGKRGMWAIGAPFDRPGGRVERLEVSDNRYLLPEGCGCGVSAESPLAAVQIVENRLGILICADLRRAVTDADLGIHWGH